MIRRTRRVGGGTAGDSARRSGGRLQAARPVALCRHARLAAGSTAGLLILAGCGHSSSASSSPASTPSSARAQSGGSAQQTRAGGLAGGASASSSAGAAGTVTGSSGPLRATLRAGTHKPKANRPWPVHFRVIRAGSPAKASVGYEFLLAGQVVARRSHYSFTGSFSDVVVWPSASVGYPLTFRAVIASDGARISLDYPVQVTK